MNRKRKLNNSEAKNKIEDKVHTTLCTLKVEKTKYGLVGFN